VILDRKPCRIASGMNSRGKAANWHKALISVQGLFRITST